MGLSVRLTVRDGRTGLWVTESSCVVDGVFVCQRVQECTQHVHARACCASPQAPRRTSDLFCVSLTAALRFYGQSDAF